MRAINNDIVLLVLKNNQKSRMSITKQTLNIRENTNQQIRSLGNNYYDIKIFFDRLKFKRDDLFKIGKELEEEYKNKKDITPLQNQMRRMKEAILCWYAKNFYHEVFEPNSYIINKLMNIKTKEINKAYKNANISRLYTQMKNEPKTQKKLNDVETSNINDHGDMRINQEIDDFEFSNINGKSLNNEIIENSNFDYAKLLQF